MILGRACVHVKVCACPGRDAQQLEATLAGERIDHRRTKPRSRKTPAVNDEQWSDSDEAAAPAQTAVPAKRAKKGITT
jgi:hypothetical protein